MWNERFRTRSHTTAIALALALVGAIVGGGQTLAQQAPVFQTSVELATVHAAVLHAGRPVLDLTAADFTVLEAGRERPISVVLSPEDTPLDVALVLDYSDSMEGKDAPGEALALIESLDERDCIFLLPFNQTVGSGRWGSPGDPELRASLRDSPAGGTTALYDAIIGAHAAMLMLQYPDPGPNARALSDPPPGLGAFRFDKLYRRLLTFPPLDRTGLPCPAQEPEQERRRLIMVLTDGADTASLATATEAVLAGWRTGIPVYALAHLEGRQQEQRGLVEQLRNIVRGSGGYVVTDRSLQRGYARITRLLRSYYVIGYRPREGSARPGRELEWRDVTVRMRDPRYEVFAQSGRFTSVDPARGAASLAVVAGLRQVEQAPEPALEQFRNALTIAPDLVPAWYGSGLALARLGRTSEAIETLRQTARLAPWLTDVHGLLAPLYLQQGQHDLAWEHGIRAARAGIDVDRFFDALRRKAPEPEALQEQLSVRLISLQRPVVADLAAQLAIEAIVAAVAQAIVDEPDLGLASIASRADARLALKIDEITPKNPRAMKARVRLYDRSGRQLADLELKCADIDDAAALARWAAQAVAAVRETDIPRFR